MKMKVAKAVALVLAMVCIFCFPVPVSATAQGTDGTELEVIQPQNLEIQLGESWAGVEFELKTDAGMYPGTIAVGEDGVLRLEIGGSENYILSCLNSKTEAPVPGETIAIEADPVEDTTPTEVADDSAEATDGTTKADDETTPTEIVIESDSNEDGTVAGIPIAHIALFGGGLVVAVGALFGIHFFQKRRENSTGEDDENDEI